VKGRTRYWACVDRGGVFRQLRARPRRPRAELGPELPRRTRRPATARPRAWRRQATRWRWRRPPTRTCCAAPA